MEEKGMRETRQMGQSGGKKKREGEMDRPRSGAESVLCSVLLLGRSAMPANRVSRSRSGLNDGAADPSLSTCMRVDQPDQCTCTAETCRCAPLSFNYARRTPFFPPLLSSTSLHLLLSSPSFADHPSISLLSVIFARSLDESSGERERERESLCSRKRTLAPVSPFSSTLTRSRIDSSPPRRRIGTTMGSNPVDGYKDSVKGVSVQAGEETGV